MLALSLEKISDHLKKRKLQVELQKETNQLCVTLGLGNREYPLFIRIFDGGILLQLLAFLPCNTKATTRLETSRLLHILNKEMDLPGFGMDESNDVIFYRLMLPVKDKQLDESIFDAMLNAIETATATFTPVIAAVAFGSVACDDVLKFTKEQADAKEIK